MLLLLLLVPLAQYIGGLMRVKGVLVEEDLRNQKKRNEKHKHFCILTKTVGGRHKYICIK